MKIKRKNLNEHIQEYQKINEQKKPVLFVRDLVKKYFGRKKPAINKLNFSVYPGEFHAFIGGNGAGKTTTIKSLIGAYYNWTGTVLINGIPNTLEKAKQKIGYIPEAARFPEKFSAEQYLRWMVMLSGIDKKTALSYVEKKLKELNMYNLRKKSPNDFSSGQKKKILLAQALIHDPDIIIMDEPVANLDPAARLEFFNVLLELKKKGKAIFISSHVLAELDRYFDSATILDGGEIVFTGDKNTLMNKYIEPFYRIKTNDNDLVKKYLKEKDIRHQWDEVQLNYDVYFNNDEQIKKFQNYLLEKDILIELFERTNPSLDQIYKKLIVKGSVDTMKG